MKKFYLYKMTVDNGGAPCVQDGILSLAICKPRIRSSALKEGEEAVLLGFAAKQLRSDNRLIYIARVTKKVDGKTYYGSPEYRDRADCIYKWNERTQTFDQKQNPFHQTSADLHHDLGKNGEYKKAWVLLSEGHENFRYFGTIRLEDYKAGSRSLKKVIEV